MNRRDLLKMIGIGGVGAVANVVSGKEVEAVPEIADNVIRDSAGNAIYNLPTSVEYLDVPHDIEFSADFSAIMGTASIWLGTAVFDGKETPLFMHIGGDE